MRRIGFGLAMALMAAGCGGRADAEWGLVPREPPWLIRIGGGLSNHVSGLRVDPSAGELFALIQSTGAISLGGQSMGGDAFLWLDRHARAVRYASHEVSGVRSVAVDGEVVLAGVSDVPGEGFRILRYDRNGDELWERHSVGTETFTHSIDGVAFAADGAVYAVGDFEGTLEFMGQTVTPCGEDVNGWSASVAFVVKLSAAGEMEWLRTFPDERFDLVAVTAADELRVVGSWEPCACGTNRWGQCAFTWALSAIDGAGTRLWREDVSQEGPAKRLVVDGGSNAYILFDKAGHGQLADRDIVIERRSATGAGEWLRTFEGAGAAIAEDLALGPRADVLILGNANKPVDFVGGSVGGSGSFYPFVVALDDAGKYIWSSAGKDSIDAFAYWMDVGPDGIVYTAGTFGGELTWDAPESVRSLTGDDVFIAALKPPPR